MAETLGAYIHFPFCRSFCTYCDFFKLQEEDGQRRAAFLAALHQDIAGSAAQLPESPPVLDSVFLGGGSPSLLPPDRIAALFDRLSESFRMVPGLEATIEVNPDLPFEWLGAYRRGGLNRISIGIQTLDDEVLAAVGRRHRGLRGIECAEAARSAGFRNVSIDLIAGLPGQDPERWPGIIDRVVALEPDHISVYLLETDKDTVLVRRAREGRVRLVSDEAGAAMYNQTRHRLRRAGYRHYEISSWCRPGKASRHNLKYWTDRPFLGFGPSAHGDLNGVRYARAASLQDYLERPVIALPRAGRLDAAGRRRRAEEAAILGLRRLDGIDPAAIEARYDFPLRDSCRVSIAAVVDAGLLEIDRDRMRLTDRGLLLANEVFQAFLVDPEPG